MSEFSTPYCWLPGHGPYHLSCLPCTSYRCYLRSQYLCNIYPHQAQVSTPSWFWKCWLLITKAWQRFQTEWAKIILSLYYFNKVYSYNIVKTQSTINHTQGWRCDISKLLQSIISLQKKIGTVWPYSCYVFGIRKQLYSFMRPLTSLIYFAIFRKMITYYMNISL